MQNFTKSQKPSQGQIQHLYLILITKCRQIKHSTISQTSR